MGLKLSAKISTIQGMNEQSTLPENENDDNRSSSYDTFSLDIDAALAAVTSLSDIVAEREAEESAEQARIETEAAEEQARMEWAESYVFPRPSLTRMERGQLSSVIPAILLIVSGAYLTFALTLSDTPPSPGIVTLIVCGVVGITLLSHWLSSGRWARGALFLGLALLFTGGVVYIGTILPVASNWTLLVGALGLAVALSGLLGRPLSGRIVALGLGIVLSAGFMFAVGLNLIPFTLVNLLQSAWIVVLPIVALLILLALVFRRRTV
jgi:hypothetical protein